MAEPGWFPDPAGRHEKRYFDGTRWSDHVVDLGVQGRDPVPEPTSPSSAIAPYSGQLTPTVVVVNKNGHGCLWALAVVGALGVALIVILVAALASTDVDDDKNPDGVDRGFGTQDAAADVTNMIITEADTLGFRQVQITVTNNSSKRSNYYIELSIESPDGATKYDDAIASVSNLDPGQSTTGAAIGFVSDSVPSDAVVKLKTVSRTAS
jgi:hypothetical protein